MDLPALNRTEAAASLLFKRLPSPIFSPLSSANREQYWSILCSLHRNLLGPDAPMPPSNGFLMRELTQAIEGYLADLDAWQDEDGGAEGQETPIEIRANATFHRFLQSGWLREDRYGIEKRISMDPAVGRFLSQLIRFAEEDPVFVGGKVLSIEANLKLILEGDDMSPFGEAASQTRDLMEHVRNTGTSIRDIMNALWHEESTAVYVRRFFSDFVEKRFIGDYRELHTRNHPLSRRPQILHWVSELHEQPHHRERLIGWYASKRCGGDRARAEMMFERDVRKLLELRRIDEYLERLDDEIRRANRRALTYLDYRIRAVRPIGRVVDLAIERLLSGPDETSGAPFPSGEMISPEQLAEPRRVEPRAAPAAFRASAPSPEEMARSRLRLKANKARQMNARRLAAWLAGQMGDKHALSSSDIRLETVEDIRGYQIMMTAGLALATGSRVLRDKVHREYGRLTVRRLDEVEASADMITGVPFQIEGASNRKGQ